MTALNLIVIRTADIHRLKEFYNLLELVFDYHKHDKGPYHYSCETGSLTIEIYPLAASQTVTDKHLRLGFTLEDFDEVIAQLKSKDTTFISEPVQTDYGYMAVVEDPDGRKIELYRNQTT